MNMDEYGFSSEEHRAFHRPLYFSVHGCGSSYSEAAEASFQLNAMPRVKGLFASHPFGAMWVLILALRAAAAAGRDEESVSPVEKVLELMNSLYAQVRALE